MEGEVISQAMRLLAARRMRATITCAVCGREVPGVMARRLYCSAACKQKAVRQRAKQADPSPENPPPP